MRRLVWIVFALVVIAVLVVGGGYLYLVMTGGSGEASQAISAPTLEPQTANSVVYSIIPEESEVRFVVDEDLRTGPNTVVGTTRDVAGDIALDSAHPANSEIGLIRINVRTLTTDSSMRNNTLRSFILKSAQDQYEFAEFQPTAISGLPDRVSAGQPVSFQVTGDLTVTGTTRSVTFDTTATLGDDQRLTGQATATVQYKDFNLTIPNVPSVLSVEDNVRLEIDFTAAPGAATSAS